MWLNINLNEYLFIVISSIHNTKYNVANYPLYTFWESIKHIKLASITNTMAPWFQLKPLINNPRLYRHLVIISIIVSTTVSSPKRFIGFLYILFKSLHLHSILIITIPNTVIYFIWNVNKFILDAKNLVNEHLRFDFQRDQCNFHQN